MSRIYSVFEQIITKINLFENNFLKKTGGTMTGSLHMSNKYITDLAYPGSPGDAANKKYVDERTNEYVVAKGTFTNGGWRKWNSGVAEIWESKIIMYDETIGHLSNGDFLKVITFPFSFIDIYYAATFGAAGIAGGAAGGNIACGENGEYSNRSRNSMKLIASSDGTTWQYPRMSYHVIGRWK